MDSKHGWKHRNFNTSKLFCRSKRFQHMHIKDHIWSKSRLSDWECGVLLRPLWMIWEKIILGENAIIQRYCRYNIFSICKLKPYSNKRFALSEMVTGKILGECAISMYNNYPITFKHTELCFLIHYVILTF